MQPGCGRAKEDCFERDGVKSRGSGIGYRIRRKRFLREHWKEVTDKSGQQFNYGILESNEFVYNTEPPCRAAVTMRHLKPEVVFDYFVDVQKSF